MQNALPHLKFLCLLLGGMGAALAVRLLDVFVRQADASIEESGDEPNIEPGSHRHHALN